MLALLLLPTALSLLLLATHFLRAGHLLLVLLLLALLALPVWRRRWARRVLQGVLAVGALEWLATLYNLARLRGALGEPWLRMALILGGVAAFTTLAAALLERKRVRRYFDG